jgi:hypothetical protein
MVMSAVPYDCYLPLSGSMDHHYLLQGIFRVKTTLHLNRTNVPLHPPLHNNKQGSRLVVVEAELNCTNDKLMSILCIYWVAPLSQQHVADGCGVVCCELLALQP